MQGIRIEGAELSPFYAVLIPVYKMGIYQFLNALCGEDTCLEGYVLFAVETECWLVRV